MFFALSYHSAHISSKKANVGALAASRDHTAPRLALASLFDAPSTATGGGAGGAAAASAPSGGRAAGNEDDRAGGGVDGLPLPDRWRLAVDKVHVALLELPECAGTRLDSPLRAPLVVASAAALRLAASVDLAPVLSQAELEGLEARALAAAADKALGSGGGRSWLHGTSIDGLLNLQRQPIGGAGGGAGGGGKPTLPSAAQRATSAALAVAQGHRARPLVPGLDTVYVKTSMPGARLGASVDVADPQVLLDPLAIAAVSQLAVFASRSLAAASEWQPGYLVGTGLHKLNLKGETG